MSPSDAGVFLALGMTCAFPAKLKLIRSVFGPLPSAVIMRFLMKDTHTPLLADELAVPIASHFRPNYHQCSCFQKTRWWFAHALTRWPHATYYAKTEDDTFIHMGKLLQDLSRPELISNDRLLYGLLNTCNEGQGRYIGDFEGSVGLRGRILEHVIKGLPFPTGPLAVFSRRLAQETFGSCAYTAALRGPNISGQRCMRTAVMNSSLRHSCDCAIGIALNHCVRGRITAAHMTWTKGHHFDLGAGGKGWVRPGPETVTVHGNHLKKRKRMPWMVARNETHFWSNRTSFPPILWSVVYSGSTPKVLLLNRSLQMWYLKACIRPTHPPPVPGGVRWSWQTPTQNFGCHYARGYDIPVYADEKP